MLIAGVDDAGRGSVIGPLVIAGILMRGESLNKLSELNVKDSKLLSRKRREKLAFEIKLVAEKCCIVRLTPAEIDMVVQSGRKLHKLNRLEAKAMANVIETLNPDVAYVDASDVSEERFKQHIQEALRSKVEIISEHKADRKYPIVSAASIIAKVERDREIAEIARSYGDVGCGYPSDPKTINFLKKSLEEANDYPAFVRKSWKPARKLRGENAARQARLV